LFSAIALVAMAAARKKWKAARAILVSF
jgi:hypothetical protein